MRGPTGGRDSPGLGHPRKLCGASGRELAQTDQQASARWTRKRSVVGCPERVWGDQASPQGHWDAAWGALGAPEEVARAGFPAVGSKSQGLHRPPPQERVVSLSPRGCSRAGTRRCLSERAFWQLKQQTGGPRRELKTLQESCCQEALVSERCRTGSRPQKVTRGL